MSVKQVKDSLPLFKKNYEDQILYYTKLSKQFNYLEEVTDHCRLRIHLYQNFVFELDLMIQAGEEPPKDPT